MLLSGGVLIIYGRQSSALEGPGGFLDLSPDIFGRQKKKSQFRNLIYFEAFEAWWKDLGKMIRSCPSRATSRGMRKRRS
jgi:hypothetical protein